MRERKEKEEWDFRGAISQKIVLLWVIDGIIYFLLCLCFLNFMFIFYVLFDFPTTFMLFYAHLFLKGERSIFV